MSFESLVTKKLAELSIKLNEFLTNSKRTEDFPEQSEANPESKIRVSNSGLSESVTVEKIARKAIDYLPKSNSINSSSTNTIATSLAIKTLNDLLNLSNYLFTGYKINRYQSAIDNGALHKSGSTQTHLMPELNDAVHGFIIGFRYLSKYNALYASDSSTSDTTYVYKFNPEDLSDYRRVDIAKSGFAYSCQLSYSKHKDRLYAVLGDNFSGQTTIEVIEIDPETLAPTNVISYPIENPTTYALGQPQSVIINEFLYIGAGYQHPRVYKFNLETYEFHSETIVSSTNNILYSMTTDGNKIYLFSTFTNPTQYITRINAETLAEEQTGSYTFPDSVSGGFTDDSIEIGDYLYVPIHLAPVGFNKISRILKSDLTQNIVLDLAGTEITESLYAIQFDGNLIWYAGLNNILGSYNPKTGENILYENPMPYNVNEIISDGQRLFVAGFDTLPVSDTGFVGRFLIPDKVLERHYIDTSTGERLVSFNADGTIELPNISNMLIDNSSENTLITKKWFSANLYKKATISISELQLKGLGSSPMELLTAQGENTLIIIKSIFAEYTFNTTPYPSGYLYVFYNGTSNPVLDLSDLINKPEGAILKGKELFTDGYKKNTGLILKGSDMDTGDGSLILYITYEILNI